VPRKGHSAAANRLKDGHGLCKQSACPSVFDLFDFGVQALNELCETCIRLTHTAMQALGTFLVSGGWGGGGGGAGRKLKGGGGRQGLHSSGDVLGYANHCCCQQPSGSTLSAMVLSMHLLHQP
jgi:hypothetical protein